MRYFFDTEFNETVDPIELISVGVVAEDGRELYAINDRFALESSPGWDDCKPWVNKNVKTVMDSHTKNEKLQTVIGNKTDIKNALCDFTRWDTNVSFWAYYGHYDWVLICRLFGFFDDLPVNWPHASMDINQYRYHTGISLPPRFIPAHNALVDARWTKYAFDQIHNADKK